jgi:hypothetical protein
MYSYGGAGGMSPVEEEKGWCGLASVGEDWYDAVSRRRRVGGGEPAWPGGAQRGVRRGRELRRCPGGEWGYAALLPAVGAPARR